MKAVIRYAEKLREKQSQRLLRNTKYLQERRTKEKSSASRLTADTLHINQSACDKAVSAFLKDVAAWVKAFKDRQQLGQDIFEGHEV